MTRPSMSDPTKDAVQEVALGTIQDVVAMADKLSDHCYSEGQGCAPQSDERRRWNVASSMARNISKQAHWVELSTPPQGAGPEGLSEKKLFREVRSLISDYVNTQCAVAHYTMRGGSFRHPHCRSSRVDWPKKADALHRSPQPPTEGR